MMNMFQLQEQLQDFSQQQLAKEMQAPSGNVPQYMVLAEMQRRKRMQSASAADQAQQNQTTVAQDAVAAAGVPQAGIGGMMQAMAPKTDMVQNTGQSPVQQMYGGGVVKAQQGAFMRSEGFGENVEYNYDTFLGEMGLRDTPDSRDAFRRYQDRMNAEFAVRGPNSDPSLFMPFLDEAPQGMSLRDVSTDLGAFSALASEAAPRRPAAAPALPELGGSGGDSLPQVDLATPDAPPAKSAGQRALEAFTGGVSDFASSVMPDLSGLEMPDLSGLEMPDLSGLEMPDLSGLEMPDLSGLLGAAESADPLDAFGGVGPDMSDRLMEQALARRPGFRPGDTINIKGFGNQTLDELRAIIADPNSSPGEREAAQTRLSVAQGVGSVLQGTGDFLAEPVGPEGSPTLDMLADAAALTGRAGNYPIEIAGRAVSVVAPETGADILDWTEANKDTLDSWATAFEPIVDTGTPLEIPEEGIEALMPPTPVADQPTTSSGAPSDGSSGISGGSSGGSSLGGSGAAVMSDLEKNLEQDKWLALAKFGLGLMASSQPTLGGAIGEAGLGAVGDFQQARQNFEDAKMARATLAARQAAGRGGSGGKPIPAGIIGNLEDRLAAAEAAYGEIPPPETGWFGGTTDENANERSSLAREIATLRSQINRAYGSYGLNTGASGRSLTEIDARLTPGG